VDNVFTELFFNYSSLCGEEKKMYFNLWRELHLSVQNSVRGNSFDLITALILCVA
jgi:hypothetical protein